MHVHHTHIILSHTHIYVHHIQNTTQTHTYIHHMHVHHTDTCTYIHHRHAHTHMPHTHTLLYTSLASLEIMCDYGIVTSSSQLVLLVFHKVLQYVDA